MERIRKEYSPHEPARKKKSRKETGENTGEKTGKSSGMPYGEYAFRSPLLKSQFSRHVLEPTCWTCFGACGKPHVFSLLDVSRVPGKLKVVCCWTCVLTFGLLDVFRVSENFTFI